MKNILCFILLFVIGAAYGQGVTTSKNYVRETTSRSITSPIQFQIPNDFITTTYFDGLGRPIQIVDQNSSPDDSKNIVTHIEYEKNIGQTKEYLPFLSSGYGLIRSGGRVVISEYHSNFVEDSKEKTLSFYKNFDFSTSNPYSENRKEASPRQRVLESGFPGSSWALSYSDEERIPTDQQNTIRNNYDLNAANEVKRFTVSANFDHGAYKNSIQDNGYYAADALSKTITKNENWKVEDGHNNTSVVFQNSAGNTVLKRDYNQNQAYDTYYVYNDLEQLVFVLPPLANGDISAPILNKLCYQYNYDNRGRLVEKKLPAKDWEYLIYDKSDRVVMSGPIYSPFGDESKGWSVVRYDPFGRIAYTGFFAADFFDSASRNSIAQNIFGFETRQASGNIDGIAVGYTNSFFPVTFKLLTVTYYDDYNYPNAPTSFPVIEGVTPNRLVKGQVTGAWTRVLETPNSTQGNLSYNLYDSKYRPIRSFETNHTNGYTQIDSRLSFTGVVLKSVTTQKQSSGDAPLLITDNFTYDRRDRLVSQTQQINTGQVETIFQNVYDGLGKLVTKNVGGSTGNLQKVEYKYNIRGWLTRINNPYISPYITDDEDTSKLFNLSLNYTSDGLYNWGMKRLNHDGNIHSATWRTQTDNIQKGYGYYYDHLKRLTRTQTIFQNPENSYSMSVDDSFRESLTYDKNGNILTLNRTGKIEEGNAIEIDDLTYDYDGNVLQSIADATNNSEGFNDVNTIGNDFTYDSFGNIKTDKNKGITNILYNHLNLPKEIIFNHGKISYIYDASGTLLVKTVEPTTGTPIRSSYSNGFDYINGILETFPHAEGYVKHENGNYLYHYIYRDHLGNSRLVYTDSNKNGVIDIDQGEITEENHYYAFGMKQKTDNDLAGSGYKYKFGGKEWDSSLGLDLYDFGARNYDPTIGRWMNVDPLAEDFAEWTPYNYTLNNPINLVDPTGMAPEFPDCDGCKGFILAVIDNTIGTRFRNIFATDSNAYRSGVQAGHTTSLGVSAVLAIDGAINIGGGTAGLTGSGALALTGVGAPVAGVTATGSGLIALKGVVEVAAAAHIASTTVSNMNSDSAKTGKGRGTNNRTADPEAAGTHTVINDRGSTTYTANPKNPNKNKNGLGFETQKRVDYKGAAHVNKKTGVKTPTPHVQEKGEEVRKAIPGEDMPKKIK